jgi:hypothetical protein
VLAVSGFLQPGDAMKERTRHALSCVVLLPIETEAKLIEQQARAWENN